MTLTRTDLEDLTAGTIIEYRRDVWPAGSCIRGPLESFGSDRSLYILTGLFGVRQENGDPCESRAEITVISEAKPEPSLYVNNPRTEPAVGDIVRDRDGDAWRYDNGEWFCAAVESCDEYDPEACPIEDYKPLTLLWDGVTGEVVR